MSTLADAHRYLYADSETPGCQLPCSSCNTEAANRTLASRGHLDHEASGSRAASAAQVLVLQPPVVAVHRLQLQCLLLALRWKQALRAQATSSSSLTLSALL